MRNGEGSSTCDALIKNQLVSSAILRNSPKRGMRTPLEINREGGSGS
jgi:hypothetical protein